jgi:colanic acid/amylovoran biosynthesis glycosyltransferase
MNKKVLIITTDVYPFGHSELLFSENIDAISKSFDYVEIFSLTDNQDLKYKLPSNVFANHLNKNFSKIKYTYRLIKVLIITLFSEIRFLKKNGRSFTLSHLKVLINTILNSIHFSNQVEQKIKKYDRNDLIFSQSYWCNDVYLSILFLKKFSKIHFQKTTSYLHGYDLVWERHKPNYLPLRWFIDENSDKLFFVSEFGRKYYSSHFTKTKSPLIVNYLGVTRLFDIHKTEIDHFRIVSCSRIIPLKRIHLIIEALSLIDNLIIEWVHFGSGELESEIKILANRKLLEKSNITFYFMGNVKNDEIQQFYALNQVDLFLNVSEYEGVPISIMEAMAYGIPCLATDVGGVTEIVDNQNGMLVDKNISIKELKDQIEYYLNNEIKVKEEKSHQAVKYWAEKFNSKTNYRRFIDFYFDNNSL